MGFLDAIGEKFQGSDKAEVGNVMGTLVNDSMIVLAKLIFHSKQSAESY